MTVRARKNLQCFWISYKIFYYVYQLCDKAGDKSSPWKTSEKQHNLKSTKWGIGPRGTSPRKPLKAASRQLIGARKASSREGVIKKMVFSRQSLFVNQIRKQWDSGCWAVPRWEAALHRTSARAAVRNAGLSLAATDSLHGNSLASLGSGASSS